MIQPVDIVIEYLVQNLVRVMSPKGAPCHIAVMLDDERSWVRLPRQYKGLVQEEVYHLARHFGDVVFIRDLAGMKRNELSLRNI